MCEELRAVVGETSHSAHHSLSREGSPDSKRIKPESGCRHAHGYGERLKCDSWTLDLVGVTRG